ncbi:MAG: hypothetical protein HN929_00050 [Chloroflexi bacterium]|jgi:hypothetical protein|nr:hypothetical protein [Chloroflexota bacterium]
MKLRKRLFWTLAVLTLLLMAAWMSAAGDINEQTKTEGSESRTSAQQEAYEVGADIGTGLGVSMIFCMTMPFFFLFALLGWRNGVGIDKEKKHAEMLAAMQGQQQSPE